MSDHEFVVPPPMEPETRIFTSADVRNNACLNLNSEDWYAYAEGYKMGAERLVESANTADRGHDFLVYPIAFMYRQYLELRLKEILRRGPYLLDDPVMVPSNHNLRDLWARAKSLLQRIWTEKEGSPESHAKNVRYYAALDSIVEQFAEIDPGSFAFRYPVTKTGTPSLPGVQIINTRLLATAIASVAVFLDGSVMGIAELGGQKSDNMADMADWASDEYYEPGDY